MPWVAWAHLGLAAGGGAGGSEARAWRAAGGLLVLPAELTRLLQQPASSWEGAPLHAFAMAPQAPTRAYWSAYD